MKLSHLLIAGATAVSFSAIAADEEKQNQQPQARSGQAQRQASQGQAQDQEIVKQVQQKLSEAGHQVQVDGIMGPKTQAALKEYQQSKGLEATGQLDQKTMASLGVGEAGGASVGATTEKREGASAGGTSSGGASTPSASESQPSEKKY